MTKEEQLKYFDRQVTKMRQILESKADDYAGEDRLSNFKVSGAICRLTPEQNCLSLIATKVARLGNLLSSKEGPKNESIADSILDLGNYAMLLGMIHEENYKKSAR